MYCGLLFVSCVNLLVVVDVLMKVLCLLIYLVLMEYDLWCIVGVIVEYWLCVWWLCSCICFCILVIFSLWLWLIVLCFMMMLFILRMDGLIGIVFCLVERCIILCFCWMVLVCCVVFWMYVFNCGIGGCLRYLWCCIMFICVCCNMCLWFSLLNGCCWLILMWLGEWYWIVLWRYVFILVLKFNLLLCWLDMIMICCVVSYVWLIFVVGRRFGVMLMYLVVEFCMIVLYFLMLVLILSLLFLKLVCMYNLVCYLC